MSQCVFEDLDFSVPPSADRSANFMLRLVPLASGRQLSAVAMATVSSLVLLREEGSLAPWGPVKTVRKLVFPEGNLLLCGGLILAPTPRKLPRDAAGLAC